MGIKNFAKFLRTKCPQVFHEADIKDLAYQKCAVDIASYIYKWKIGLGEKWILGLVQFLIDLRRANIHAIIVLDGQRPIDKQKECDKRKLIKTQTSDLVLNVRKDLEIYKMTGEKLQSLKDTIIKIEKQKFLLQQKQFINDINKNEGKFDPESVSFENINISEVLLWLIKKESQLITVNSQTLEETRDLLDILKVPYINAKGEAEGACSSLCNNGQVDFVVSVDSDCVAYCAKKWITNIDVKTGRCLIIHFDELCKELDLTKPELIDFCIGCGCDYNSNIPGIGNSKMYALIKEHKTLETVALKNPQIDCSILNYENCRKNFTNVSTTDFETPFWDSNFNIQSIETFLLEKGLSDQIDKIKSEWKHVEFDFELDDEL